MCGYRLRAVSNKINGLLMISDVYSCIYPWAREYDASAYTGGPSGDAVRTYPASQKLG